MRGLITKEQLWEIFLAHKVLLEGHFVLASGRHAPEYFNKVVVYQYPWMVELICQIMALQHRQQAMRMHKVVIAGPTVGGVALSQFTARALTLMAGKPVQAVFVDEGPERSRLLKRGYDAVVRGASVLLIEDVLTTADSVVKSADAIRKCDGTVMGVMAILNRRPSKNTPDSLGVPALFACIEHEFADHDGDDCPLCAEETVPINTDVGKGVEFLAARGSADPA